ncbi:MAG: DUF4835 family protein [Dysgonamonadaceae bacterium]|jgi:hypothetical protein|nr:DUF4835 family protein [Dysgonamonadaceae bacterium]
MKKSLFLIVLLFCLSLVSVEAQELHARVSINSDRIQGTNKSVFNSLEVALNNFISNQKWGSATFAQNEKIECSFALTIMTVTGDNSFSAELLIQAQRPVYNSAYNTTLVRFRDTEINFEYMDNTPFQIVGNMIDNNLVATITFWANLILALDFDSFSPKGGSVFFRQAQSIVMQAQGAASWNGWTAFGKANNKHGIITSFIDESMSPFRELWYTYHRKGLDEMTANPDRARTTILNVLPVLEELKKNSRVSTVLLQLFADSKLDEIVSMSSKAGTEEKQTSYELLRKLYPTMSTQLEPLKK